MLADAWVQGASVIVFVPNWLPDALKTTKVT